jgi:hypothetical protein
MPSLIILPPAYPTLLHLDARELFHRTVRNARMHSCIETTCPFSPFLDRFTPVGLYKSRATN